MSLSQNKADLFGKKSPNSSTATKPSATSSSSSSSTAAPAKPAPAPAPAPVSKTAASNLMSNTVSAADNKMKQKKIEEAQDHSKRGMEYLKTSMFQWKPDHLAAAPCFESSAECYKMADQIDNACGMMVKAAESHEAYGSYAAAALALMKAAAFAKQGGDRKKSITLTLKAAQHWGIHGDLQRYGDTLGAAAKECEDIDANKAFEHYKKAIEVVCPESMNPSNMAQLHPSTLDLFRNASSFCVKSKKYKEAIALFKRMVLIYKAYETESAMCKAMLSITILQLALGDAVLAQNTYLQEHLNNSHYLASKESEVADLFILAFNNQDIEQLEKAQRHVQVNYLDIEVRNVAKGLSLLAYEDSGSSGAPAAAPSVEKSSLFASSMPKAVPATSPTPPVAPAAAAKPSAAPVSALAEEDAGDNDDDGAANDVNIDDIVIEDEEEQEETEREVAEGNYNQHNGGEEEEEGQPAQSNSNNQAAAAEEEDDELDLS